MQRGADEKHHPNEFFSKFKFSNGFSLDPKKEFQNLEQDMGRYGKIRQFKCDENSSSDHTMTTPK